MPRYDYRCAVGHEEERIAGFDDSVLSCGACGSPAQRMVPSRPPLMGGFAIPPMNERRIPLSRFVEAQGQMVRDAERAGVSAPDVLGIAKRQAAAIRKHAPEMVSGT